MTSASPQPQGEPSPASGAPTVPRGLRWSGRLYRRLLGLYPRPFRQRWAEATATLFTDLGQDATYPGGLVRLWARHLPDLVHGLAAEWWRELLRASPSTRNGLTYGAVAGVLLSTVTAAGNLGWLWSTPQGSQISRLLTVTALTAVAIAGVRTMSATGRLAQACRAGLIGGLVAFSLANLTGTAIAVGWSDRLSHDPLQLADFARSQDTSFSTYQLHELAGGWIYGTVAGAVIGALCAPIGAFLCLSWRACRPRRHPETTFPKENDEPGMSGGRFHERI